MEAAILSTYSYTFAILQVQQIKFIERGNYIDTLLPSLGLCVQNNALHLLLFAFLYINLDLL